MTPIGRILLSSTFDERGHLVGRTYRVTGGTVHARFADGRWSETFEPDVDRDIALERENRRATRGFDEQGGET